MRILLVDDHALFREGMKYLLQSLKRTALELVEAESCEAAVEKLENVDFDLVLLDLKLPGKNHMEALSAVKEVKPDIPVVVLSGEESPALIRAAIDSGAMGFIPKSSTHEILTQAIKLVLAGGVYLPSIAIRFSQETIEKIEDGSQYVREKLSERQLQVLRLIIEGKSNKGIANKLHISENTVKTHVSAVMRALNTRNRTETVYQAAQLGMTLQ